MAITFHLTTTDQWERQCDSEFYEPDAFADEGFIHCTDGLENLISVGNRYYRTDKRAFLCLAVELDRVGAEVIYEDPEQIYPHIYGRLETAAVQTVRTVLRSADGDFLGIE